jgi:hypothetical protein
MSIYDLIIHSKATNKISLYMEIQSGVALKGIKLERIYLIRSATVKAARSLRLITRRQKIGKWVLEYVRPYEVRRAMRCKVLPKFTKSITSDAIELEQHLNNYGRYLSLRR